MLTLAPGSIDDLDAILGVMRGAFDPTSGEAWNAAQTSGMLTMAAVATTIARLDGAVAGFAIARTVLDETELMMIAVTPASRGIGIGGAALRYVLDQSAASGVCAVFLEMRAGNPARSFYLGQGFQPVGRRTGYYRGPNGNVADAITFRRELERGMINY